MIGVRTKQGRLTKDTLVCNTHQERRADTVTGLQNYVYRGAYKALHKNDVQCSATTRQAGGLNASTFQRKAASVG